MAELKLNSTTSIVDFLKSRGKPSDFGSRETLFKTAGLDARLDKYTGSPAQNIALLKQLQTPAPSPSPTITPTTPAPEPKVETIPPAASTTPTIGTSGISATDAIKSIPGIPSAEDILAKVYASPQFGVFQQKQQLGQELDIAGALSEKQELESKTAEATKEFITSMGRRGLFFSGETESGLQALTESLAASKLKVDRKLAGQLLEQDLNTRERVLKDVEGVVKDAQAGRKEALDALKDVGLTVIGDKVVPTLAAQREARVDEAQQAQLELSQARFELSQAKSTQEMANAATRIELAQARFEASQLKQSAAEKQAAAAVQLYNNTIQQVIGSGLTPADAVEAAVQQALITGVVLGVEEQNTILQYATLLQGEAQKQAAKKPPAAGPQSRATQAKATAGGLKPPPLGGGSFSPSQAAQPFASFFGRLFTQ